MTVAEFIEYLQEVPDKDNKLFVSDNYEVYGLYQMDDGTYHIMGELK